MSKFTLIGESQGEICMQTEFMKQAYGLVYEIENCLRRYIEQTMQKEYGVGWFIEGPLVMKYKPYNKNYNTFHFHELVSMLRGYPCFVETTDTIYYELTQTVEIRNKVAHSQDISDKEMVLLQRVHKMVMEQVLLKLST
ncbi:hypothetical protein SAMN05216238_1219 [Lentibacillus persicus]|uniref:Uncharacterized protein n=2 Tax=Lentibacillus persicus TaxID=640948 RepID=A0A1I2B2Q3_9BACI|nr:hypothetical protein SAMN05216238_1219 [Lentibacillus persicus]